MFSQSSGNKEDRERAGTLYTLRPSVTAARRLGVRGKSQKWERKFSVAVEKNLRGGARVVGVKAKVKVKEG